MHLRKKEWERGRVGFWDVVGGDSPAATGIFWAQGGDEQEERGKEAVDEGEGNEREGGNESQN